nr:hypothetical protein [Tanacetum cinerariifolium]
MDQDSADMVAASKVPMLKPENGNVPPITKVVEGVETTIAPTTAEEKAQGRLELKIRSTLLMGIPNELQLNFNLIKDVKSLLQAVEKRLQKLISKLEIHGESILQEDVNQKFLRSLSPKWNTHTIVWRNKPEINTLSLDDLYKNLKIYEPEVKGTSSLNTNTQNVAFVSSNSTNSEIGVVNTAHDATTASTQTTAFNSTKIDNLSDDVICAFFVSQPKSPQLNNKDMQQIHPDDLKEMDLRWQMAMLTVRARRFLKDTRRKFYMNGTKTIEFDKSKVECYNCHKRRHFVRECKALRNQENKNRENTRGLCQWRQLLLMLWCHVMVFLVMIRVIKQRKIIDKCKTSLGYNAIPPPYTGNFMPLKPDLSFSSLEEIMNEPIVSEPTVKKFVLKTSEAKDSADKPEVIRKNFGPSLIEDWISYSEDKAESNPKIEKKTVKPSFAKIKSQGKVIRCDNGTEFKNKEMNQFCEMKGIMRQYSVARTPQQNKVAERRYMTLIEAAKTMLADSKLPTTFWVKAVNIVCYVQNRVLVVKPHNKTPYELFHGITPALRFMRPFECPVIILNTKDHLGKFDGKADEAFFVRYSINSKGFIVFNIRTRIVEENMHIRFSENTPNIARSGPNWIFDIDALTKLMNYKPVVSSPDDEFQPSSDDGKKVDKDPRQENECKDQENEDNVNITNNVNAVGTNEVNVVGANTSNELPFDPEIPALEDISTFNFSSDHENEDEMANINNLDTTIQASPNTTTRIHKDHPLDQVIGDLHSTTQTRNMLKNLKEHRLVTTIHQRTNHKDLQNCLFACFLSQKEPKKVIHALKDPSWIEAMQEELLQFKLQEVWTLVDLPNGKRAIGTKWVFQNKKDEREVKNASTPIETQKPSLKDEDSEEVDVHIYRLMINSLMYLTSSRLDIMFVVCACARYQVNPKVSHLHVVKRIFRANLDRKSVSLEKSNKNVIGLKNVIDLSVNVSLVNVIGYSG